MDKEFQANREERAASREEPRSANEDPAALDVGRVAHDINNLLTVILGNLELLERRAAGAERKRIATALEAARQAACLTQTILRRSAP